MKMNHPLPRQRADEDERMPPGVRTTARRAGFRRLIVEAVALIVFVNVCVGIVIAGFLVIAGVIP